MGHLTKEGNKFSWSNKRNAEARVYSQINWAFGNDALFNSYTGVEALYMLPGCSDHTHILIDTEIIKTKVNRPYRLLLTVMQQKEYKEAVQRVWSQQVK